MLKKTKNDKKSKKDFKDSGLYSYSLSPLIFNIPNRDTVEVSDFITCEGYFQFTIKRGNYFWNVYISPSGVSCKAFKYPHRYK